MIRDDDSVVYGDSGYLGIGKRAEILASEHLSSIDYRINRRPGKLHHMQDHGGQDWERLIERQKSSVRCKVEHPFRFIKVQCGFRKVAYRGGCEEPKPSACAVCQPAISGCAPVPGEVWVYAGIAMPFGAIRVQQALIMP